KKKPCQVSITKVKKFAGSSVFVRRSQWSIDLLRQVNGIDPNRVSRALPYFNMWFCVGVCVVCCVCVCVSVCVSVCLLGTAAAEERLLFNLPGEIKCSVPRSA